MQGTLINAAAVIAGSLVGLSIHSKLPEKITKISFQGIGLFTLFLGVSMASETDELILIIFSMVLGSITGEALDLDNYINKFSEYIKSKIKSKNDKFTEGFITSFLLFCVGSMTILGAIEEGLGGKPNLLLAKSVLDGFSSIALASTLGAGVLFSFIPLLIFQGAITLGAGLVQNFLTPEVINLLTSVGGLLLIGLGINILEIKKIKITNMLPSLVVAVVLGMIFI
ncbi:MAG: DUF554 domain-containing protein [Thermodesulfobacteriota bacterium]